MGDWEGPVALYAGMYPNSPKEFFSALEKENIPADQEGIFFINVANYLSGFSFYVLALASCQRALKYFIKEHDKNIEIYYTKLMSCYNMMEIVYEKIGDFKNQIKYLEKVIKICDKLSDEKGKAIFLKALDEARWFLKISPIVSKAFSFEEKAAQYSGEKITKWGEVLGSFYAIPQSNYEYYKSGGPKIDFRKAVEYKEKAFELYQSIDIGQKGAMQKEAELASDISLSYHRLGDFPNALKYQQQALELYQKNGDLENELNSLLQIAGVHGEMGNYSQTLESCKLTLSKVEENKKNIPELSYHFLKAGLYSVLNGAYCFTGDFDQAIIYQKLALKYCRLSKSQDKLVKCYAGIGAFYKNLGDKESLKRALYWFNKSLNACQKNHEKDDLVWLKDQKDYCIVDREIAQCYTNIGVIYYDLKEYQKAVEYQEKALPLKRENQDTHGEASCYLNLGNAHFSLGHTKEAIRYQKLALELFKKINDKEGITNCYANLGMYFSVTSPNKPVAKRFYEQSLKVSRQIGDVDSERLSFFNMGVAFCKSDPQKAYDCFRNCIELSEMISGRLVIEKHKISYYSHSSDVYQLMVPICLLLGKEEEAFEYAERSRSKAFLDMMASTSIKPSVRLTDELQSLLDEEKNYLDQIQAIRINYSKNIFSKPREIQQIRKGLEKTYNKIDKVDPEYAFIRRGKSLSLDKIQLMLRSDGKNVVLIEYFVLDEAIHIFVVSSRDNKIHVKTIPLTKTMLENYLDKYQTEIVGYYSRSKEKRDIGNTWLGLSKYLIDPISEYIFTDDVIYFIPHDMLHYLPLHALLLNGEPVICSHPVAYSPSASLINFCQKKGSDRLDSVALFGVGFEEETKEIGKLLKTEPNNNQLATKKLVLAKTPNIDIIHFSCHGIFNDAKPLSSGLVLFNSEVLTAREIYGMRLNSELVVLSACETGLSQISRGDDLIGLTRAFIYAGAATVIVSLWPVSGYSTLDLMTEFYKLLKEGKDKATALQNAQIRIMDKYSHPYFWAPFILIGDYQRPDKKSTKANLK
jgi:CHAT domain-containing protein